MVTPRVAHRVCSQAHGLLTAGNKKIHFHAVVNRVLDLHLGIRERDSDEESPKCECSDTVDPHMSLGATQSTFGCATYPPRLLKTYISCPKTFCVCAFGPWECIPSSGLGKRWAIGSAGCGPNSIEYPFL